MQGLLVIMMALIAGQVTGHPHGAPTTACNTMFPLHKHHPQTSACPFETRPYQVGYNLIRNHLKKQLMILFVILDWDFLKFKCEDCPPQLGNAVWFIKRLKFVIRKYYRLFQRCEEHLKIDFSFNLNYPIYLFAGYMIMAFEVPSENAVALGTFQVSSDSHTINCHGMQQVTIWISVEISDLIIFKFRMQPHIRANLTRTLSTWLGLLQRTLKATWFLSKQTQFIILQPI